MKRLDDQKEEHYVKACVYGRSGTGKTSFGVTAPKPLILLSERQGMTHIRQAVHRLGVPMPQVLFIEQANDYRNVLRGLQGDKTKPFKVVESYDTGKKDEEGKPIREKITVYEGDWPESVVLDSMTDACRLLVEEIRRQSPPQIGRDGLPVDSQRFWNVLPTRAQSMILGFRDLPMHVLFLALADDRERGEDDQKVRTVSPMLPMRSLPETLAAAVNVMGFTYRKIKRAEGKNEEREIEYGIQTTGPEYMLLKPYRPLRDSEVPDFTYWCNVIKGEVKTPRPAPSPSQELGGGDVAPEDRPVKPEPEETPPASSTKGSDAKEEPPKAEPAKAAAPPRRKRRAG